MAAARGLPDLPERLLRAIETATRHPREREIGLRQRAAGLLRRSTLPRPFLRLPLLREFLALACEGVA